MLKKQLYFIYILLLYVVCIFNATAQNSAITKDTSYTIYSVYKKEVVKRSYITIAEVQQKSTVQSVFDIPYKQLTNRLLLVDIFYPRKVKKTKPAVLLIFGGGWQSGDKNHNHTMAKYLANSGYVALSVEYRLSDEAIYPAALHDIKDAVKWTKQNALQFGVDTNKIAILGCSAGAQLATLVGTTNGNSLFDETKTDNRFTSIIHAIINIDGIVAFHHPESAEGKVAAKFLGGSFEEQPETWKNASPLTHVNQFTPPTLFINSSIPRFHAGRNDMIALLNKYGIYNKVFNLNDSPHSFWFFNPWFKPMMQEIIAFLQKTLH